MDKIKKDIRQMKDKYQAVKGFGYIFLEYDQQLV